MNALTRRASRGLAIASLWLAAAIAHAGTVHYHYTDAQGTSLATADAQGAIVSTNDYAPYGSAAPNMSAAPDGPGYTGHVNDPDTGLVYMQARYYDPGTGGFLSVDPVSPAPGNLFSFNRYAYANNNPVMNIDPDGRLPQWLDHLFPKGDLFRTAGESIAADTAFVVGAATNDRQLQATAVDGMQEVTSGGAGAEAVIALAMVGEGEEVPSSGKTFTTYTRAKADGTVYSGRTSGKSTPEQQVASRTNQSNHPAKASDGYGPAKVDKNSSNPAAIRGREQQLIEQNGGARSQGGTSGNAINGVSPTNSKGPGYRAACAKEFGC